METDVCVAGLGAITSRREVAVWSDLFLAWVDAHRRWLFGALVGIYIAGINGQWRIEPDSALYLSLARSIALGHGYTYHHTANASAYPGLPYFLAATLSLFSSWQTDPLSLFLPNLLMPLAAGATLALTYRMFRIHAGRPTAVLVTCIVGLTRTFYRAAFALMTDMPFLLGVMAFLAGYEGLMQYRKLGESLAEPTIGSADQPPYQTRRWLDWALVIGGGLLTIVMRPAWLAFVPVALIGFAVAKWRGRISWRATLIAIVLAAVAAAAFYLADPRQSAGVFRGDRYEDQVVLQFLPAQQAQLVRNAAANAFDILRQFVVSALLGIKFGPAPDDPVARHWIDYLVVPINFPVAIVTLGLAVSLMRRRAVWGCWVIASIAMMVLVLPLERYFLQVLPLLIYAWWRGMRWLNRELGRKVSPELGNLVFFVIASLGFVPNVLHVFGVVIEQRSIPFLSHYHDGKYQPLITAAARIRQTPADTIVLAPYKTARILSYLSDRDVYEINEPDLPWPPRGRPVSVLQQQGDDLMQGWLANLHIDRTAASAAGTGPGWGNLELRHVQRGRLPK